ncbi:hypothetical protein QN362_13625 [Actimicrobium sp. CCC2.4]|uniref:hypothetical protein n=1 Tax=Actimicrobium sp. CCC2.4 TaxID=3048606 RepID=UPI002AC9BD6C|nr:hypothetical protein [Actimicrobium sp. CCC2.4]MEB0136377.1 hypothetical protein [Actimicrobium sp. CCC2.4]WPX31196.1 hypothetical protein RHM62_13180 [Actimicrobium sp. CCC2.4]
MTELISRHNAPVDLVALATSIALVEEIRGFHTTPPKDRVPGRKRNFPELTTRSALEEAAITAYLKAVGTPANQSGSPSVTEDQSGLRSATADARRLQRDLKALSCATRPPTMLGLLLSTREMSGSRAAAGALRTAIAEARMMPPVSRQDWQHLREAAGKAQSLLRVEQSFKHAARNAGVERTGMVGDARQKFRAGVLGAIKSESLVVQQATTRRHIAIMIGEYKRALHDATAIGANAAHAARRQLQHQLSKTLQPPVRRDRVLSPTSTRLVNAQALLAGKLARAIDVAQQARQACNFSSANPGESLSSLQRKIENLLLDLGNLTLAMQGLEVTERQSPTLSSDRQQHLDAAVATAADKLAAIADQDVIRLLNGNLQQQRHATATVRDDHIRSRWRYAGPLATASARPERIESYAGVSVNTGSLIRLFDSAPANRVLVRTDLNKLSIRQLLDHHQVPKEVPLFDATGDEVRDAIDLSRTRGYHARIDRSRTWVGTNSRPGALWNRLISSGHQLASSVLRHPVRLAYVNSLMKRTRTARRQMHEDLFVARKMLAQGGYTELTIPQSGTKSTFWQRMKARGFGRSSFSTALGLPFMLSRQKTPAAINARKVIKPEDGWPSDNPAGLPPLKGPVDLDQFNTSILLPADHPISGMLRKDYLLQLIRNPGLFPGDASATEHAQLMQQLQHVEQQLRPHADKQASPQVPQEMALLARALSAACVHTGAEAMPARRHAARALACLRNIDLTDSLRRPAAHRTPPSRASLGESFVAPDDGAFTESDHALAWRTAQMLAETPSGMALLTTLTRPVARSRSASVIEQETLMLKLFLTAGAALDAELKSTDLASKPSPVPAALLAYAERSISQLQPGQNSVLVKALNAIPAHLRHSEQFTDNDPLQPIAPDTHRHDWAIGVVRNGMTSDVAGSPFSCIEDRLIRKIAGKWVDLATSKATTRWQRVTQRINPLRYKSPFNAFNKTDGSFKNTTQGATLDRRHMRHASDIVEAILDRPAPSDPSQETALRTMVRLAFLRKWKTKRFPTLLEGDHFDQEQLEAIAASLAANPAVTANPVALKQMLETENKPYLPELLDQWMSEAITIGGAPTKEQQDRYAVSIARVKGATTECQVGPITRENLANNLANLVRDELELGAGITLTNGGTLGFGTKGMSATVLGILTAWTMRGRINFRMRRLRHAALEIKLSNSGVELRAGSQAINSKAAGIGFFSGVKANFLNLVRLRLGVGMDAEIGRENEHFSGVVLRLPRGHNGVEDEPAMRSRFAEVIRRLLLRDATNEVSVNAPGSDGASPLKNLLQQFSDLSVNLVGKSLGNTRHMQANTEAAAAAFIGPAAIGPTAAVTADRIVHRETYQEAQGRVRVERTTRETGHKINLNARLVSGIPMAPVPLTRSTFSPPATILGEVNTDVWKIGSAIKHTLVFQDGQIDPKSFAIETHRNLNGFIDDIVNNLDVWCAVRARKFYPDEYHGGPERQRKAIEEEHRRISHFIFRARNRVATTQTFYGNLELKPVIAAEINRLLATSTMMALNGDIENSKKIQTYCQLRLMEKVAWEETNLVCRETVAEQVIRPFQAGVSMRAVSNVVTTNLLDVI